MKRSTGRISGPSRTGAMRATDARRRSHWPARTAAKANVALTIAGQNPDALPGVPSGRTVNSSFYSRPEHSARIRIASQPAGWQTG